MFNLSHRTNCVISSIVRRDALLCSLHDEIVFADDDRLEIERAEGTTLDAQQWEQARARYATFAGAYEGKGVR